MNNTVMTIGNIFFSLSIKIFLLLVCVLVLVFLFITIKQIHTINKNDDYCIKYPLISIAKFWIYITIILALFVLLFI